MKTKLFTKKKHFTVLNRVIFMVNNCKKMTDMSNSVVWQWDTNTKTSFGFYYAQSWHQNEWTRFSSIAVASASEK